MLLSIFCLLLFAVCYTVKGGSFTKLVSRFSNKIAQPLEKISQLQHKNKVYDFLLQGKTLSTLYVFLFCVLFFTPLQALLIAVGWLCGIAPSMGEEHGAIGDHTGPLKAYVNDKMLDRGRDYDFKKALQRGVWMGALMTLTTGSIYFILASLLFIPVVFIGQSLNLLIMKEQGWTIAEPLIGAILFGLPFVFIL